MADRILRARVDAANDRVDRLNGPASRDGGSFLGRVLNGGSMPTGQGRYYLLNPVDLDGEETEGGEAEYHTDTTREIAALAIGNRSPQVGDLYVCRSVSGRWVFDTGVSLTYCNPRLGACSNRYSVNGTVSDGISSAAPITWDYATSAWYSVWLPYASPNVLQSGTGSNPCSIGDGASYYFHRLAIHPTTGQPTATLVLPGQACTRTPGGGTVAAFFKYPTPGLLPSAFPGLLGKPSAWAGAGFRVTATGDPSECDPLVFEAVYPTAGPIGAALPFASATFSVPKWTPPNWGFSCGTPCPLPRKDLTLSWTRVGGNGSWTLTYDPAAKMWKLACSGTGLSVDLTMDGTQAIGLVIRLRGSPSDCSGSLSTFSLGSTIALASFTCEPLYLEFKPSFTTQALYANGYRTFTVTE